jgi:hypothetical protein
MEWDEVTHFTGGLLLSRGQVGLWVWTNSFYPPALDLVTAVYFIFVGPSVLAGRLVAVTFSVLSLFVVYEIANRMYNSKTALIASILFSVTPGVVWLSRMAMIETMLIFIFSLSMLFFFRWLQTHKERDRIITIAAFSVGVAVKYQMLVVVPIFMILGMYFWKRDYLKSEIKSYFRLPRLAAVIAGIGTLAVAAYAILASGLLTTLIYAIREGTVERALYSVRYPTPIFYFIEMTWSNNITHPVSLLLYLTGLAGIGLLVYRRKREDKFLLLWFSVVYVVFTLIPNREWRYVTLVFPVLAIAASSLLVLTFDKIRKIGQTTKNSRKWGTRLAAGILIAFTLTGVLYSCVDAYNWVARDQIQLPIEQATNYAAQELSQNQSLVVACPLNRFNKYMVWFYLNVKNPNQDYNQTWQYPQLAVDSYTPNFSTSEFIGLCQQRNVKYVLLYESSGEWQYFNSTLTEQKVYSMLNDTGRFTLEASFGAAPNRIFVFLFE